MESRTGLRCRVNDLDNDSWSRFLLSEVITRPPQANGARRVNGRPIDASDQRALYRWLTEGNCPSFFSADRFLTRYGGHIDEFFLFCDEHGLQPWATGGAPDWYARNDVAADLGASDPRWRREAQLELKD